ncbi:prolyl oligopeptidase family serine peptidase [Planctomycetota bacterium]
MPSDLVQAGSQSPRSFKKTITKDVNCGYQLFLPEGYGQEKKDWPLILFLHGMGERGDDLNLVKTHGPPVIVDKRKDFPFIVVSPQCPDNTFWNDEVDMLGSLLDEVTSEYDVDTERIYLTGLSMGGFGTWALAAAQPERFAAIAPICGGGLFYMFLSIKDLPIWIFHGQKDDLVPVYESQRMYKIIKENGGNVKLTIYPEAEHDSWTQTYDNKELYDWFLQYRRSDRKQ